MEFLKKFGIGILYAVFFPVLLVVVALVGVYGILVFIVEFVIMLINFFSGRKCFPVFPEDEEATKRKQEALNIQSEQKEAPAPAPQNIYVQQVYYSAAPNPNLNPGMPNPALGQQPPFPAPGVPFQNPQQPPFQQLNQTGQQSFAQVSPVPEQQAPQIAPIDLDSIEKKEEDHD